MPLLKIELKVFDNNNNNNNHNNNTNNNDSKKLDMWIKKIGINIKTEALQKSTLLGTARILRRTLEMEARTEQKPLDLRLLVLTRSKGKNYQCNTECHNTSRYELNTTVDDERKNSAHPKR